MTRTLTAQPPPLLCLLPHPEVCNATLRVAVPKRTVVGTACTVWTDCGSLPLTAHACGAGERFSINHQACRPASWVPCYEEQVGRAGIRGRRGTTAVRPATPLALCCPLTRPLRTRAVAAT